MTTRTAEEIKSHYIEKMGSALGSQFEALWQEFVWLNKKWSEYVELFGNKPTRVKLLNQAAPAFFRMVQDLIWEDVLLHLARVTDAPTTLKRHNLTIRSLPKLVDTAIQENIEGLVGVATERTSFCRDWRNRRIAHSDLQLRLRDNADPLEGASRNHVNAALIAVADVLNAVDVHYTGSQTHFQTWPSAGGSVSLLTMLAIGLREDSVRREQKRPFPRFDEI